MLYKISSAWSWWWDSNNATDEIARLVLTALTPLCILWFSFFMDRWNKGKPSRPPGPWGLPIVGYLPFLGSDLRWNFKDLADIYGPIFKLRLGTKEAIVITSPSLVKEVLREQDVNFANRDPPITARLAFFEAPEIVWSDYGPEWRKMKKLFVSEMMSTANVNASYYLRKQNVKKMVSRAYEKAGEVIDVGELIFSTIISSVMCMLWGKPLDEGGGDAWIRAAIAEFMQILGTPNISDYLPLLARFDLQGMERKMKLVNDRIGELFDSNIAHHKAGEKNKKDFLGYLLQLSGVKDPQKSLTLPQVKALLLDVVNGATDTTATTAEWAMAQLMQHPKVMRKVQEEVAEAVGLSNTVEETHLPKLKYLNAVLKETLRLHPTVPLLVPHCASMPTTIGGYSVPKGSQVFINVWAIQRDPQLWEDPSAFQPERFLSGSSAEKLEYCGNHFQFIPFGSGRRMCPGIYLAEKISLHVLASLVHAFCWTLPNGTEQVDLSETFGIAVKKTKPLIAIPSPRLSSPDLYSCEF